MEYLCGYLPPPTPGRGAGGGRRGDEVSSCLHCSNPPFRVIPGNVQRGNHSDLGSESPWNVTDPEHPEGRAGREGKANGIRVGGPIWLPDPGLESP